MSTFLRWERGGYSDCCSMVPVLFSGFTSVSVCRTGRSSLEKTLLSQNKSEVIPRNDRCKFCSLFPARPIVGYLFSCLLSLVSVYSISSINRVGR